MRMKNRSRIIGITFVLGVALSAVFLTACDGDGLGGDGDGLFGGGGYDFSEEEAVDINLAVYDELNEYAVKGPGTYPGTVVVEDDYDSDPFNGKYWNDVSVEFSDHTVDTNLIDDADITVDGSGVVKAVMDSSNGKYIIEYSGRFSGKYNGEEYVLSFDFKTEWQTTFTSEGTFTVNGDEYTFSVDSFDTPGEGSIPTS